MSSVRKPQSPSLDRALSDELPEPYMTDTHRAMSGGDFARTETTMGVPMTQSTQRLVDTGRKLLAALHDEPGATTLHLATATANFKAAIDTVQEQQAERPSQEWYRQKILEMQNENELIGPAFVEQQAEPVGYLYCGTWFGNELDDWEFEANQSACDRLNELPGERKVPLFAHPPAQQATKTSDLSASERARWKKAEDELCAVLCQIENSGFEFEDEPAWIQVREALKQARRPAPEVPSGLLRTAAHQAMAIIDDVAGSLGNNTWYGEQLVKASELLDCALADSASAPPAPVQNKE